MMAVSTDPDVEARLVKLAKVWLNGPVRAKEEAFHALLNFGHPKALSMVREVVTQRSARLQDYAIDYNYVLSDSQQEEYNAILVLNSAKWTDRCKAVQKIREIGTHSGKRALLSRYKTEKHSIVRRDIACALGYWNENKIVEFLKIALTRETLVAPRLGCLEGLIRCGCRDYLSDYLALLYSEDSLVRQQVVNSIGNNKFHQRDKIAVLKALYEMKSWEMHKGVQAGIDKAISRLEIF